MADNKTGLGSLLDIAKRLAQHAKSLTGARRGGSAATSPRRPWEKAGTGRVGVVGWFLDTPRGHFLWEAPRRLTPAASNRDHLKSVSQCPAVIDFDARLVEVPCPIDVRLAFGRDADGRPILTDLDGDRSAVRPRHLQQMVTMTAQSEWRSPARPIIQITTPYVFVADEPVWMSQMPPFSSRAASTWPGLVLGGRMPIHIWPRQLLWAFEWWDTSQELRLVRGEPWFYLQFESHDPSRHVRVVEAEITPELREYVNGIASVANYANRTFSLFKTAKERRPARLLFEKKRSKA